MTTISGLLAEQVKLLNLASDYNIVKYGVICPYIELQIYILFRSRSNGSESKKKNPRKCREPVDTRSGLRGFFHDTITS